MKADNPRRPRQEMKMAIRAKERNNFPARISGAY
jgi:hypothetical protein